MSEGFYTVRFPVCPRCGNICGKLARICADCGAYLYNDPADRQERWAESRRRKRTAEAMHPTGETED